MNHRFAQVYNQDERRRLWGGGFSAVKLAIVTRGLVYSRGICMK